MGLFTLDYSTHYVEIPPYMELGPPVDYSEKIAAAKKYLGDKYCCAHPINGRIKKLAVVSKIKIK